MVGQGFLLRQRYNPTPRLGIDYGGKFTGLAVVDIRNNNVLLSSGENTNSERPVGFASVGVIQTKKILVQIMLHGSILTSV